MSKAYDRVEWDFCGGNYGEYGISDFLCQFGKEVS